MLTRQRGRSVGIGITRSKREKTKKKHLKKERCKMRIFIGDHFKGLTLIRNLCMKYNI